MAKLSTDAQIAVEVTAEDLRTSRVAVLGMPSGYAGGAFLHLNGRLGRRQRPIIGTLERFFGSEADTPRPRDLVPQVVPRPLLGLASETDKVVPSPPARASFEAAQARKGMFVFPNALHLAFFADRLPVICH